MNRLAAREMPGEGAGSGHRCPSCEGPRRRVNAGQVLYSAGDPVMSDFIVRSGYVEVAHVSLSGELITVDVACPGELVGVSAWWRMPQHAFDAVAITDATLEYVDAQRLDGIRCGPFVSLCEKSCQRRLEATVCRWRGQADDRRLRVGHRLLWEAERFDSCGNIVVIPYPLTQQRLARMTGMRRETVNRLLREFRIQGCVDSRAGRVLVNTALLRHALR